MKVLSIHYGHNSTVGLSIDGEVVCLLSEERINRMKNSTGFPFEALDYVKKEFLNNDISQIDCVVLPEELFFSHEYFSTRGYEAQKFLDYYCYSRKDEIDKIIQKNNPNKNQPKGVKQKIKRLFGFTSSPAGAAERDLDAIRKSALAKFSEMIGVPEEKIKYANHHKVHAWTPLYFVDDSKEYLVLTLDGEGDGICASVNKWKNGELEVITTDSNTHSLGYLYSEVTAYLGMKPNEHEYKLMGMAPYADPRHIGRIVEIFEKTLWLNDEGNFESKVSTLDLQEHLIRELLYERFDNICGGLQLFTENLMAQWVDFWVKKTDLGSMLLSGGVFMNVKASQKISELDSVEEVFLAPSAGDESLVIGGLYYGNKINDVSIKPMTHLYLGRSFGEDYVDALVQGDKFKNEFIAEKLDEDAMAAKVGDLLAANKVVARCCGHEEWGARALGNRSIMCNPNNFRNIEVINKAIKKRDFWMPFTPSILEEDVEKYIVNPKSIYPPYMCITFDGTDLAKKDIPAALHPRDSTVRPQAVNKNWNPGYYKIISEFKKKTGICGILNTSFNLHGEPNVSKPEDALHTLRNSGLNYLVLGNYLVQKK